MYFACEDTKRQEERQAKDAIFGKHDMFCILVSTLVFLESSGTLRQNGLTEVFVLPTIPDTDCGGVNESTGNGENGYLLEYASLVCGWYGIFIGLLVYRTQMTCCYFLLYIHMFLFDSPLLHY